MRIEPTCAPEPGFAGPHEQLFPTIVNVEVYRGACPCRCRHCPVGTTPVGERQERFGVADIDLALYDKITAEVGARPRSLVRVHSVGDPVLWPSLVDALTIGRKHRAPTWLFTSAVTRDRELLGAIAAGVDILEVSVNSTTRDDYLATKGVDAFGLVSENLTYLHGLRSRGLPLRLIASRTESGDTAADDEFIRYWKATGLVADAYVRTYHSYNALLPELSTPPEQPAHQPCLVHWARFNIAVDGRVVVCFNELFKRELDPRLVLGDVGERTIAAIWSGPELAALRKAELAGDYSALPCSSALPCRRCSHRQPLQPGRPTSESQLAHLPVLGGER